VRLLVEIGTEEIPAVHLKEMAGRLATRLAEALGEAGLVSHGATAASFSTPRRLAALIDGVLAEGPAVVEERRGPPAARAREANGSWSRAAVGFASSIGLLPDALEERQTGDGIYLFGRRTVSGKRLDEHLAAILPGLVEALAEGRTMRWGYGALRFIRPIRWLVCLADAGVVPVTLGGLSAGRTTRGPRSGPDVEIPDASRYAATLRALGIEVERERRRQMVEDALAKAAEGESLFLPPGLLDEITDIVETPRVLRGHFDEAYLEVPAPVLEETMARQQRFVPLRRGAVLAPAFLVVANGGRDDVVIAGNEKVLAARLADARFFYRQDLERPLGDRVADLEAITYLENLGTLGDRAERLAGLTPAVAHAAGLAVDDDLARRAGRLALADHATQVVYEWPELEGTMGAIYARASGEAEEVAEAIGEGVLPREEGDSLPVTDIGWALATALRLDHLVASFAAGLEPTGGADPYAMRRAGIQILTLLEAREAGWTQGVAKAVALVGGDASLAGRVDGFLRARLAARLTETHRPDAVAAVLATNLDAPHAIRRRLAALERSLADATFLALVTVHRRAKKLAQAGGEGAQGAAEEMLSHAIEDARAQVDAALERGDDEAAFAACARLEGPLARFFEGVMVMDPEEAARRRRQGLLHRITTLVEGLSDLGRIALEKTGTP